VASFPREDAFAIDCRDWDAGQTTRQASAEKTWEHFTVRNTSDHSIPPLKIDFAGRCRLCHLQKPLRESHIIPSFVARQIKKTSITGYLRDGVAPNLRRQDLPTFPLLCDECEALFSADERYFCNSIFVPFRGKPFTSIRYDQRLLRFAVSLAWRNLVLHESLLKDDFPQHVTAIDEALKEWGSFLLKELPHPGKREHHLFVFAEIPIEAQGKFHHKTFHYLLRAADLTPMAGDHRLVMFANLMGFLFFSSVRPRGAVGLRRARIFNGPGALSGPQTLAMPGFTEFLDARLQMIFDKPLSDKQLNALEDAVSRQPIRALESETFQIVRATNRLLRERR
jgi:hypothetical protein